MTPETVMSSAHALQVSQLAKTYRGRTAVDGVSFTVPAGSLTVLLGAAGAGKTTTLRMLAGLETPDAGQVHIGGRDVTALEPRERNVAMIFDNLALYPDRTGFRNIAHALEIRKLESAAIERKVQAVAETLRIAHVLNRLPRTMSGGERQRVALGRALVREPALFLLDEPLSSLDAQLRIELRAELKRLQREEGRSFLLATPDYAEAMAVADTVVMLVKGRVRQVAAPQVLYDQPADRDVARFVGAPEINLIPARYEPDAGGRVRIADTLLAAPAGFRIAFGASPVGFDAGVRPEHITLGAPSDYGLHAAVVDIESLGLHSTVTLGFAAGQVRATVPSGEARRLAVGESVGLLLNTERMVAFDNGTGHRCA